MSPAKDPWHIGGEFYLITRARTQHSFDLELDDVGPGVGRGTVAFASLPDHSADITLTVFVDNALPIELFDEFITEARRLTL